MGSEQQYVLYHNRRVQVVYRSPAMREPNTVSGIANPPNPEQLRGGTAFFLELDPGTGEKILRIASDWIIECKEVPIPTSQRVTSFHDPSSVPFWA